MDTIKSNPLLRLIFTILTGIGAGIFFISVVLTVIYLFNLIIGS